MSATTDFFENADLERAILVGYYGGGKRLQTDPSCFPKS